MQVQQTLTAYLIAFGLMTLWHGALSDTFGRRRVILVCLGLFALASLGCLFAGRIETLWLLRFLQGMVGGGGMVVGRALIRDLYDGPQAQKLMARIAIMFALAPAVAPVLGGWLQQAFGWRSIFLFLFVASAVLTWACWCWLPETLPVARRQPFTPRFLLTSYRRVCLSRPFLALCLAFAFNFLAFFIYVLSANSFLIQHLQLPETAFLWLFGPAMLGLVSGSWLSGRSAGRLSPRRTLAWAYALMALGAGLNLLLSHLLTPAVPWSVLHLYVFNVGMSLAMPVLTLLALDLFPAQRGLAASCQSFLQSILNSLGAGLLAPLLWGDVRHLAWGMLLLMLLGGLCTGLYLRRRTAAG
ncbi:MAG: hypothetical protein RIR00_570 [Pseudomonadota bacterium]